MRMYAVTRKDGGVTILQMVHDEALPATAIAKWPQQERDNVVSVHPITRASLPTDRTSRNAWTYNTQQARVVVRT